MIEIIAQFGAEYIVEILLGICGLVIGATQVSTFRRTDDLSRRVAVLEAENGRLRDKLEEQALRIGTLTSEREFLTRTVDSLRMRVKELEAHERKPPEVA